jgi:Ser/Thr protein kinase RdoA (MazF antagonist)
MDAAVELALARFEVDVARTTFVSASENTVYRIEARDGLRFALRVHRPGYHDLAELESENAWTTALSDAGIATPRPISARDGSGYVTVPYGDDGEMRHVGMIEWIDGEPLEDALARPDTNPLPIFFELGGLIARLHAQAVRFEAPPGFVRHRLDGDGLLGDDPWWGPFWHVPEFSPAEQRLILDARERIRRRLDRLGTAPDVFSLIHADLLPANLLLRADGGVAAIDFDDVAYGWHLYDLATALHVFAENPRFAELQAACLAGYRDHRPLADEHAELLPLFLLIRCLVEIGWFDSRLQGHLTYDRGGGGDRAALIPPLARQAIALVEVVLPTL